MSLKPMIRDNIALNAHPLGCKQNILNQIAELKSLPQITDRPLNVLIIGGSSGYGLATRIALTYKAHASTYNVSFERAPKGKSTGSAGYYNNFYFNEIAAANGFESADLNADCFSHETKNTVIDYFKSHSKKIDIVVYSVASGIRIDPDTGLKYTSALKPVGQAYSGYNIDITNETLRIDTLSPATQEEIKNTVKVMGGEDYILWAKALIDAQVLNQGCTFITYTYLGSQLTHPIYKDGTIGYAKRDLECANNEINTLLSPLHGTSFISASKAVVTKASVFIPTMALYASALFKIMKKSGLHESIVKHKYRLFKDMIFGDNPRIDADGIIRLDHNEMNPEVQASVHAILNDVTEANFKELVDFKSFKKEFLSINGFEVDNTDYSQDVHHLI